MSYRDSETRSEAERKRMENLFTSNEVSDRTGIPEATLRQWRWLGIGPAYVKLGKAVRYSAGDLDAWIAENRHQAGRSAS